MLFSMHKASGPRAISSASGIKEIGCIFVYSPSLLQLDLEGTGGGTSLFALFDGHSGKEVAIFAAQHLPDLLVQRCHVFSLSLNVACGILPSWHHDDNDSSCAR
eukprot:1154955-Pelagomonas_calceolata.AAC.11